MDERITFLISKDTKKELKRILVDRDETMTEFLREVIEREIDKNENKGGER